MEIAGASSGSEFGAEGTRTSPQATNCFAVRLSVAWTRFVPQAVSRGLYLLWMILREGLHSPNCDV